MADDARTIKVRCATWEQVEAFYTHKLRGNMMVVKMPVSPGIGSAITIALGLPSGLVLAIDGDVSGVGTVQDGKYPVSLAMRGVEQARQRLARLVADGRSSTSGPVVAPLAVPAATTPPASTPPPGMAPRAAAVPAQATPPPLPVEPSPDQKIAAMLEATLRRLLELPAHEVLGVAADAGETAARAGWLSLCKQYHPDVYGRLRSAEVRRLAEDVFVHAAHAYERMRQAAHAGWFDDAGPKVDEAAPAEEAGQVVEMEADEPPDPSATESAVEPPVDPGAAPPDTIADVVEAGRRALGSGQWAVARERFAAALRLDPRARPVRALYHVANGMELRERGQAAEATLQFETALVHDRSCEEARLALHGGSAQKKGLFRRLFDR